MATQDTTKELHSQVEEAKESLIQVQTDNLVAREDAKRFVVVKINLVVLYRFSIYLVNTGTHVHYINVLLPVVAINNLTLCLNLFLVTLIVLFSNYHYNLVCHSSCSNLSHEYQNLYQRELVQHGHTMEELATLRDKEQERQEELASTKEEITRLKEEQDNFMVGWCN